MWSTAKPKKRLILSIDGGGIRGAASIQFLCNLEEELKSRGINTPLCDIFDLFVGTSTGGLIASGIAHAELTAKDTCDKFYTHEIGEKIMHKSIKDRLFNIAQFSPKYDGIGKRQVIKDLIGSDRKFNETDKKVMVTSYNITEHKPVFFKSWKESNVTILNALDATSAVPSFYPSIQYLPGIWGIDGGVHSSNPSESGYIEALKLFDKNDDIRILSIGTGYGIDKSIGRESEHWGGIEWVVEGDAMNLLMDAPTEASTYRMHQLTKNLGHKHIRIQGTLENTEFDNVSKKHIQDLKNIGTEWWEQHKDDVMSLILD